MHKFSLTHSGASHIPYFAPQQNRPGRRLREAAATDGRDAMIAVLKDKPWILLAAAMLALVVVGIATS